MFEVSGFEVVFHFETWHVFLCS